MRQEGVECYRAHLQLFQAGDHAVHVKGVWMVEIVFCAGTGLSGLSGIVNKPKGCS